MKRNKTRFEKWFSLSRHARRKGAAETAKALGEVSFSSLKSQQIRGDQARYTHGSKNDLAEHIDDLRSEFIGNSELVYFHAKIIVLIRREADVEKNFQLFEQLWQQETAYLLEHLNTRWLVAAADTYADHGRSSIDRTAALLASSLVNAVKLSETERNIMAAQALSAEAAAAYNLQQNRMALDDGLSAFAVGTDDTLRNFRWRLDKLLRDEGEASIALQIAVQVFVNLQTCESIYARFRACHSRDKTGWW